MNVEIGTEAAQFPEKEYRSGIFLAVKEEGKDLEFVSCCANIYWVRARYNSFSA
jgi:hypothetical protein